MLFNIQMPHDDEPVGTQESRLEFWTNVHLAVSFIMAELPRRVDVSDLVVAVEDERGDVDDIAGLHLTLLHLLGVHPSLGNDTL
jgi:hypothetical protein